jgi:glycerol-3-phosphate O-acyltransferase/dihydroxyacetone phosphate acyltransferase
MISLGVAPVLYLLYACIGLLLAIRANAPLKWRLITPVVVLFGVPAISYTALKFGEAGMDVLKYGYLPVFILDGAHSAGSIRRSLPPLIAALIPGHQQSLDKLKAIRVQLSNEVSDLINFFGPNLD